MRSLLCLSLFVGVLCVAPSGPWDTFNLAPTTRTVFPKAVYASSKGVTNVMNLLSGGQAAMTAKSNFTLDFGKEVGGIISLHFGSIASGNLSLAYAESPFFIGANSDVSCSNDGAWTIKATPNTLYTVPSVAQRGGFRYLTVMSTDNIVLDNLSLYHTWMPHFTDLRAYEGYFFSDDSLINRIWYTGAYTVQLCTVPGQTGRVWPLPAIGWGYDGDLGTTGPVMVDAPKRDRTAWLGDLGIALHTALVSTGDILAGTNSLNSVLERQDPTTGMFNYCGPPWNIGGISDTYHVWALVGAGNIFKLTDDYAWATRQWPYILKGMKYVQDRVDYTGLFVVTKSNDWLRPNTQGRHMGANSLFYQALVSCSTIAAALNKPEAAEWTTQAQVVKNAVNDILWDEEAGMYRDNDNTTVLPQDGNSLAIVFGLADADKANLISKNLRTRWNKYGPASTEWPGVISPFISGFEVMAHYASGNPNNALDLIRLHWGYLLHSNWSTGSSFVEGMDVGGGLEYSSPPFLSQSHGWSTGPTPALSYYSLGLRIEAAAGKVWSWSPTPGNLKRVRGGFSTSLGRYDGDWTNAGTKFAGNITVPQATVGDIKLPGVYRKVLLNGAAVPTVVRSGHTFIPSVAGGSIAVVASK